jgi:hypothetical protein
MNFIQSVEIKQDAMTFQPYIEVIARFNLELAQELEGPFALDMEAETFAMLKQEFKEKYIELCERLKKEREG